MKKKILISTIIIAILLAVMYWYRVPVSDWIKGQFEEPVPNAVSYIDISANPNLNQNTNSANINSKPTNTNYQVKIPTTLNLDVPFTSQAPLSNWDEIHEDTCEEAALLMVHRFYENKPFEDTQTADNELLALVDFENLQYGDYKSTSAEETAQLIRDFYHYQRVDVVYDITINDIKKQVAQGRPVILLSAGRELGNPNFKQPGPLYHALVVKGWTETQIITNDPGTRKGHDYVYDPDVLINATHDWNNGDPANGQKVMIVIYPNN
ncbi:MAG: C39 family peptidase [Patescibacteria group bacterium]